MVIVMNDKISISSIGKIITNCYDEFEDVWTGYNEDLNKIDIVCAVNNKHCQQDFYDALYSKIGVNIAKEYGTYFVEKYCNISIITYL